MTKHDFTELCILMRQNYFFALRVENDTLFTRFGRGTGLGGRQIKKQFDTHHHALEAAAAILLSKTSHGYTIMPDTSSNLPKAVNSTSKPTTSPVLRRSNRKRRTPENYDPTGFVASACQQSKGLSTPSARSAPSVVKVKKQRRGLRGAKPVYTSSPPTYSVVDPDSGIDGAIVTLLPKNAKPVVYDAKLVHIDIAKKHDKFIILQLIYDQKNCKYVLFQRYGRTGTAGQSLTTEYSEDCHDAAVIAFEDKFKQKTALEWHHREEPHCSGMYRFVKQDFQAKSDVASALPRWQYWVDDGVDGKATGWYDYDQEGSSLAEQLYTEFLSNMWLTQRVVQSGVYTYLVDLQTMTQQNIIHPNGTVRRIRRVPRGEVPNDEAPPDHFPVAPVNESNNIHVMNLRGSKPRANVKVPKPSHTVVPAPAAKLPEKRELKKVDKSEPILNVQEEQAPEIRVDGMCQNSSDYSVVGDWDATMNQSNIMGGSNNNKYYRLQLLQHTAKRTYHVWTRWGRVGESRGTQTKLLGPFEELHQAEKSFSRKFWDKTSNIWEKREEFVSIPDKYELLQIDHSTKQDENAGPLMMKFFTHDENVEEFPSKLPKETEELVELLFEKDVYTNAMKEFDIDIRRMPLGNLSKGQIEKGVAVLEEIEGALKSTPPTTSSALEKLSSKFYTTLPHDFGRRRPPVISTMTMLQRSYDMCNVLKDMEKATSLMSDAEEQGSKRRDKKKIPNPADAQYDSLNADLKLLDPQSSEHKLVSSAYSNTCGNYKSRLLNIWSVDRKGEGERFKTTNYPNHMLLWHGSHIGAISAILATGLRIMPHSGGRVGRGIYLASENGKSQQYTTPALHNRTGCMFLVEAALGKAREIFDDDSTLQRAPKGYQSVHACGRQTPKGFCKVEFDDVKVSVPTEAPGPIAKASHSSFWQDEYLIYNEAQARIRYLITIKQ